MAGAPFSAAFAQAPVRTLDAEASLKAALAARERQLGRENVELVPSLRALALHYQSKRRFAEAEALLKRVLQLQERAYGPAHPKVAATLDDLASLARKQGRAAEAQRYAKRASDIRARVGTVKPVGPLNPTLRTAKPVARPPVARPAEVEARRAAERAQQPDQSRSYRSRRVGEAREPAGGAAPPPKTSAREYRHEAPAGGSARPGGASPRSLGSPPPVAAAPPPPAASAPPPLATARPPAAAAPPVTYNRAPSPAPPAAAPAPAGAPAPPPEAEIAAEKQSDWDVVPVYFGTDREIEPDTSRVKFSSNRGRKLQLGRALVTVPKTHEVPLIERPWAIRIPYFDITLYEEAEDPNKHFTMQSIGLLSHDQFLALVRERIAASKQYANHALVFIHGYNTAFDYAVYRTAQIAYDLKFDGAPFLYSWPSGGGLASYTYDKGSVEQAEPYLRQFLNVVVKESGAKSVSIIAHSMGNELLLRVLQELRYSPPEGVRISQVILAAPDVDRDKFENIVSEIKGFAEGVTLYAAGNDRALAVSRSFNGGVPRAGDVPETGPMILQGVDTIDVTAASTDSLGLNHSSYAENNGLLKDIAALIESGVRPPDKRFPGMKLMSTPKGSYWQFPGATQ
jgi:esterase/lipase superfamily enzyme